LNRKQKAVKETVAMEKEALETGGAADADEEASGVAKQEAPEKKSTEERLEAAQAEAKSNYDRLLRLTAEFENYKKRMEREMEGFRKFANESLIKEILPVVDNLERALDIEYQKNEDALEGLREGVEMTLRGLLDTLEKFGVVPLEALGKPFDPNFHQAVSQEETDKYPDNTVSRELQKGYMLRDRLVRAPMVVVSKCPDTKTETESTIRRDKPNTKIRIH
jgi:molecular chaperone GrpE